MKKLYSILFVLSALRLAAQPYDNEWIDFSKTYYKFRVGTTGLYRLPQSALAAAGLGSVPAQNFQLFRNGVEVPIYTSVPSGPLSTTDYLEFWGQMNDGAPDNPLYRVSSYQHTTHKSLETDTAVYFLTVNPTGSTFHFQNAANNAATSSLTPEPYLMYTSGSYFHNGINPGYAQVVGEYLYSSSYDIGEFWSTGAIYPGSPFTDVQSNLFVYSGTGAPDGSIKFGMVGTADNPHTVQMMVNGSVLADTVMNSFNDLVATRTVPIGQLSGSSATVNFINNSTVALDRIAVSFYELTYPRQFNFNGQSSFNFQLPAKSAGYLLNITNFGISGGNTPVLYDLTNGLRYTAVINGSTLAFALPGSTSTTQFVLVNEDPGTLQAYTPLTVKNFVNFANTSLQGNFVIISNPVLYNDGTNDGVNPVNDYKTYRSSSTGGGFNAQFYDVNELIDQFAFGIKMDPLSIQNFLRYARNKWATKPQYVLLIGHALTYPYYTYYSEELHDPTASLLNLVPTFGYPASDNKLTCNNGADAVPVTPIGRLSVETGAEIEIYLNKLKEYEQTQVTSPNTIAGRLWMKNVLHLTGVSEPYLGQIICNYMFAYQAIISDTLYGASVSALCDGNASAIAQVPSSYINTLFSNGFSVLNYFGHSSSSVLAYNLNNPYDYDNPGKYPIFFVNGCNAGDFYEYDAQRPNGADLTLSESYVLANERGSIAFEASSGYQIVNYCNIYLNSLYNLMDGQDYGKPLGILQQDALQAMSNATPGDFFARQHIEQMDINGDPYVKLNQGPTDYDVEASTVSVNPTFVSVNLTSFTLNAKFYNLGKAVSDSVGVLVQRTYPNGTTAVLFNKKIRGIRYSDSIQIAVPIVATRDVGDNKITVTIDPGNVIPEVTYANNTVTTDVYIYQNGASPVYPYNYAIINTPTSKLVASTNNPLLPSAQYVMQIDTTQSFNSSLLVTKYLTSIGGELEFDPGITYMDSVVYYWRVGAVPTNGGQTTYANASFVYIDQAHSGVGFNQSHYFQHLGSAATNMSLTTNRQWTFNTFYHDVYQRNTIYPDGGLNDIDFSVTFDGNQEIESACVGQSIIFNVFNPVTFIPWLNVDTSGKNLNIGGSGSANCGGDRNWNFEFSYMTPASRDSAVKFMQNYIPNGYWVTVKNIPVDYQSGNMYAADWQADTALYGAGNDLYDQLKAVGLTQLDSFYKPRAFLFIYKKNDPSFVPQQKFGNVPSDDITLESTCPGPLYSGNVTSPQFGPAKAWGTVHWRGADPTSPVTDTVGVQVIGIDTLGNATPLYNLNRATQDLNISAVNATQYPYLQLKMSTYDAINGLPYQLQNWRVAYTPAPEGALAPNLVLKAPDSVVVGQPIEFAIAFKNVSPFAFDSMTIKMYVIDANNVTHNIVLPKKRPIASGDTLILDYVIPSTGYTGLNTIYVDFNPNTQPEQYFFNNFVYKTVYVKGDSRPPLLDVTFDNVHILNNDIVSAKPHVEIKLTSLSQYLLLKDTSTVSVQVVYPNGVVRPFYFSNADTLKFNPATTGNNNVASVEFTPAFTTQFNPQGDVYTLIVTGKDEQGNMAGATPYRVSFTVITKPMISNMLNYPNPFTTSTAFVFTITGSDVPQNIKIQILTITGKVVREITKEELGPLHVGLNITEFKWNGTDMYGQRLANGVYLYHVVTNLNGKSLSKYSAAGDNTDKYFNNGYGKMYLMR